MCVCVCVCVCMYINIHIGTYILFIDGSYITSTRAHPHTELIRECPWEPTGAPLDIYRSLGGGGRLTRAGPYSYFASFVKT